MNDYNNDPIIYKNCFCCNNLFIQDMLESGLFDLPSHTKNHSYAFERILGYYFNMKLDHINEIDINTFNKNLLISIN